MPHSLYSCGGLPDCLLRGASTDCPDVWHPCTDSCPHLYMVLAFGISGGPATIRIVQYAPGGEAGTGTSVMITSDFLGGVLGVAAYAVVFSLAVPVSIGVAVSDLFGIPVRGRISRNRSPGSSLRDCDADSIGGGAEYCDKTRRSAGQRIRTDISGMRAGSAKNELCFITGSVPSAGQEQLSVRADDFLPDPTHRSAWSRSPHP